ncbi:MAG: hypothetical protein A2086_10495 [Spirochaetes bacterium GWD1_27_9]|nr:MAG: hypothetical protein A2Z98_08745 [Spirochaetes bacterium GWB1_27_13]OHD25412.1 MAG: hypothetical protein A2Y34_10880 [Spirochaetes bacterium GWC1_27_15]OHD29495.1 MAG: hypothetical protein A2086_10495 [Spirochaetes bacterium GWD1_27_9]
MLYNLKLLLSGVKTINNTFKTRWQNLFNIVENKYDIPYLIFLGDLLAIIDNDPSPEFISQCYSDVDMFGGREQNWILKTKNITLYRSINQEINDSWQHVDVSEDILDIKGLPDDIYIDWDGDFSTLGGGFEIKIGNIDDKKIDSILELASFLFNKVESTKKKSNNIEKLKVDLKREYKFDNTKKLSKSNEDLQQLLSLLNDKDYDVALGALERIKTVKITEGNFEIIKIGFFDAFDNATMPVRKALAEHLGFLRNNKFCDVLLKALDDKDSMVLECVLHSLGYIGDTSVLPNVLEKLKHNFFEIRWAAVSSLSHLITSENKEIIFTNIINMLDDDNHNVRSAAICVINNNLGNKFNNKILIEALSRRLKDNNEYIKRTACFILGELSDPLAIDYLKEFLNDYNKKEIEEEAKKSLKKLEKHKNNPDTKEKNPKSKEL